MVHFYLLAFSALAAVPVLLHMLKKGQPKRVIFPAMRFLLERQQKSRRRSQLQNLLLLLVRVAIMLLACLALARPLLPNPGIDLGQGAEVRAVIVLDLSPSMGQRQGQTTPLDESRRLVAEMLDRFAPESAVQILRGDGEPLSGSLGGDAPGESGWGNVRRARQQMEGARLLASQGSVVPGLRKAARLLEEASRETTGQGMLNLLVVLSDRTTASWQGAAAAPVKLPEGAQGYWVDVGGEAVPHVAITQLRVDPPAAAPGSQVRLQVELRARGDPPGGKTAVQVSVGLDNDPDVAKPAEKKAIELTPAEPVRLVEFTRQVPLLPEGEREGYFQFTARVQPDDALPVDNTRGVTLPVRREILVLTGNPEEAEVLKNAMDSLRRHPVEVRPVADKSAWSAQELAASRVVWLAHLENPPQELWNNLESYLRAGGSVIVLPPAGPAAKPSAYSTAAADAVLPANYGALEILPARERGWRLTGWDPVEAFTTTIQRMITGGQADFTFREYEPLVWRVRRLGDPEADARVVASFEGKPEAGPFAILGKVGTGRVLQLATGLDGRLFDNNRGWNNFYTDSSIGLVLIDQINRDMAGTGSQSAQANWIARPGQRPEVDLPSLAPAMLPLRLRGPGLQGDGNELVIPEDSKRLVLAEAEDPGNYQVRTAQKRLARAFSLALDPNETDPAKAPQEEIEQVLGSGRVLTAGKGVDLQELMTGQWQGDLDLLPWILALVVILLAVESWLANRVFGDKESGEAAAGPRSAA